MDGTVERQEDKSNDERKGIDKYIPDYLEKHLKRPYHRLALLFENRLVNALDPIHILAVLIHPLVEGAVIPDASYIGLTEGCTFAGGITCGS